MTRNVYVGMLALAVGCVRPAGDGRSGAAEPVFREIHVVGDTIRLGQTWRGAARLRAAPGDSVVALPRGSFGNVAGISVHLAPGDTVRAISFEFPAGANYEAMVAEYTTSLGKPARRTRIPNPGPGPSEVTAWEDARTALHLMRGEVAGQARVASALFDRQLSGR